MTIIHESKGEFRPTGTDSVFWSTYRVLSQGTNVSQIHNISETLVSINNPLSVSLSLSHFYFLHKSIFVSTGTPYEAKGAVHITQMFNFLCCMLCTCEEYLWQSTSSFTTYTVYLYCFLNISTTTGWKDESHWLWWTPDVSFSASMRFIFVTPLNVKRHSCCP